MFIYTYLYMYYYKHVYTYLYSVLYSTDYGGRNSTTVEEASRFQRFFLNP